MRTFPALILSAALMTFIALVACSSPELSLSQSENDPPALRSFGFIVDGVFVSGGFSGASGMITVVLPARITTLNGTASEEARIPPAVFDSTGVSVTVNGAVQQSGLSQNDFTRPVTYVVTGDDAWRSYVVYAAIASAIPEAPRALDLRISGIVRVGERITAEYRFMDANGDREAGTRYQWYRLAEDDAIAVPIPDALGAYYTLTDADQDCLVQVAVRPKSLGAPAEGVWVRSEPSARVVPRRGNAPPSLDRVWVSGDAVCGGTIAATPEGYHDPEADPCAFFSYQWLLSDSPLGLGAAALSNAAAAKLTLPDEAGGRYIACVVTPVAQSGAGPGNSLCSSWIPVTRPMAPVAQEVRIVGAAECGLALTGVYRYHDADGDLEGSSRYRWYRGADPDHCDEVIDGADERSYVPGENDRGKYLRFEVQPMAAALPQQGATVSSAAYGPILGSWRLSRTIDLTATGDCYGIALDRVGSVYVHCSTRIRKFLEDGSVAAGWGSNGVSATVVSANNWTGGGIAVDASGAVYIPTGSGGDVQILSADGTVVSAMLATDIGSVRGVAVSGDGSDGTLLWVTQTDTADRGVIRYERRNGAWERSPGDSWGSDGVAAHELLGTAMKSCVAAADHSLYLVAASPSYRLVRVSPEGDSVTLLAPGMTALVTGSMSFIAADRAAAAHFYVPVVRDGLPGAIAEYGADGELYTLLCPDTVSGAEFPSDAERKITGVAVSPDGMTLWYAIAENTGENYRRLVKLVREQ